MEAGTSSNTKPCYYDDLPCQPDEDGIISDEDPVGMSLNDSFEMIQLDSDSEIGSDLFVDKMMNESAGICDVMITEARQPNSRSRKLKMRRKLKMSFEKYKDMRVCEDEDSVFSDVPEDEDLSEIDEDWLNAEIDSDSSCISRLDDPLMPRSKKKTNGKKSFDDVIRSNSVKKSNDIKKTNDVIKSSDIKKTNDIIKSIVIKETNDVIKSSDIKKTNDIIKSSDIKKTNDVIKSIVIKETNDVIKSIDIKDTNDVIKSRDIKKTNDVIKESSLKLVNEESEENESRNVGTILSMWEQKRSDEKKNVCEVEQFDSGTIGRLKGAKSLFEKLSSGVSQTLPRSWKSSRPSIMTSSDRYNGDKILKQPQDDVEMIKGSKINCKDPRTQKSLNDYKDVVLKCSEDLKDLKTSKNQKVLKIEEDAALQSPKDAEDVGGFKDHQILEASKKFHETQCVSKEQNKDLKVAKETSKDSSNPRYSGGEFESTDRVEESFLPTRSLSPKIEKMKSFERPESSCYYSGNFTDEDLSDVSSLSSASTDEEQLDDLLL